MKEVKIMNNPQKQQTKYQQNNGQPGSAPQKKISFSELKIWDECAYKHKLIYIDKIKKFNGNEYTCFGTALHHVCENLVIDESTQQQAYLMFEKKFLEELTSLKKTGYDLDKKMISNMRLQSKDLVTLILPELKKQFVNYKVISVEESIYESITDFDTDYNFKGFIDLIIQTDDEKYHVIDWKSCSWGWDMKRRTDKMTTYQLTLYKNFFCLKYNIDASKVETHFALLKRTAKKDRVEIFRVSSGSRKMKNAIDLLQKAIINIDNKNYLKNRLSCNRCEFFKTNHCR